MRKVLFLGASILLAATFVHAGSLATSRSGFNDTALWPGTCQTGLSSVASTSTHGIGVTATDAGESMATTVQVNTSEIGPCTSDDLGWYGNFAPGDGLLWTEFNGPLTLTLGSSVSGAGVQIEAANYGAFTAQICDNLGHCFSENGISNGNADNSAIFIGILDPGITSVVFSLTSCIGNCNDFAINDVSLKEGVSSTPEPSSILLFGTSLLGLAPFRRKLFGR